MANSQFLVLFGTAIALLFTFLAGTADAKVDHPSFGALKIYDQEDFSGQSTPITLTSVNCINIPQKWNDRVKSIELKENTCVQVYDEVDCEGTPVKLTALSKGVRDLGQLNMKAKISSLSPC